MTEANDTADTTNTAKMSNACDTAEASPAISKSKLPKPAWAGKEVLPVNLVLEGGAMRGQFTAGVLDYFMEHDLFCDQVYGVSAGALAGYCYVAGEIGRTCFINMRYCTDSRYLSMRSFLQTGNACGRQFAFHDIPEVHVPFNFDAFENSPISLTAVSSDLELGEADYHEVHTLTDDGDLPYLMASSSMPLVSQIVEKDGKKLLDGGTCDSVPIFKSMMSGKKKHIVVLTQAADYIKGPNKLMPLLRQVYSDFPYYLDRLQYRHFEYNRTYRSLARMHEAGECFVIRPQKPVTISSMEHDPDKLLDLYEQGYAEAQRIWNDLQAYLAN